MSDTAQFDWYSQEKTVQSLVLPIVRPEEISILGVHNNASGHIHYGFMRMWRWVVLILRTSISVSDLKALVK